MPSTPGARDPQSAPAYLRTADTAALRVRRCRIARERPLLEEMLDTWERATTEEVVEQAVAERLRRIDNRRMDYLRSLFGAFCPDADDVEARCMLYYSLLIGNHFIAAGHGARSRADVVKLALRRLGAH